MDIEELKKLAKNKIEAEDLTKQVRRQIKETTWAKQNLREGFSETYKPLISKFDPLISVLKNLRTQKKKIYSLKTKKCCKISWLLQKV